VTGVKLVAAMLVMGTICCTTCIIIAFTVLTVTLPVRFPNIVALHVGIVPFGGWTAMHTGPFMAGPKGGGMKETPPAGQFTKVTSGARLLSQPVTVVT